MGVVDDAINKEEKVRAILDESSARLRAKIEARRAAKLAVAKEAASQIKPSQEASPLSARAEKMLMSIDGQFRYISLLIEDLKPASEDFDEEYKKIPLIPKVEDLTGLKETEIVAVFSEIEALNKEIRVLLDNKNKQRDKFLEGKTESQKEPEIEVVTPEVVEGASVPRSQEAKSEKPGEEMDPIDIEIVETNLALRRDASEKDRRLIELSRRLDEARRFYIEQDREMDKGATVWKRITGVFKRLDSGTLKESFENSKLGYEDALREYKKARLDSEIKNEEDARVVAEWLTKGEFLTLANEKLDSQMKEGVGWKERGINWYLRMVDGYRKLSTTKKIVIGLGISTVGFGLGLTGGTLLAGGILTSRQIFSMSVSAVGFKGFFDGRAQRSKEKERERETETLLQNSRTEEMGELDFELFSQKLDQKIEEINLQIQSEKKNQRYRNWAAVGSGVALSYVARYFGKEAVEHSGAKGVLKDAGTRLADMVGNQKDVMGIAYHPEASAKVEISDENFKALQEQAIQKDMMPEADLTETKPEEPVSLKVAKGSSLEGTIIQHLKDQGINPDEAGKKAHLMALEFLGSQEATEHHLIQPDAKINLDATGEKILNVDGSGSAVAAPSIENAPGLDHEKLVEHPEIQPSTEMEQAVSPSVPEAEGATPSLVESGDVLDESASVLLGKVNTDLAEWQDASRESLGSEKYVTLGANFTKSLAKLISGNDFHDWMAVKERSMRELLKGEAVSSKRLNALLDRLLKAELPGRDAESIVKFREIMKPNRQESVYSWTKRIAILVKHLKISKI